MRPSIAGWSSSVARRAHNPKVVGSNPAPATKIQKAWFFGPGFFMPSYFYLHATFTWQKKRVHQYPFLLPHSRRLWLDVVVAFLLQKGNFSNT